MSLITPSDPLLDGLNPEQLEAVRYRGPALLIVAGAGSGKTSVLTRRIASLIRGQEAWPSQILAITFTNKAAAEMRERAESMLGAATEGMWISTFHSSCVRILRREAENFGFTKNFTIYDSHDSRTLIKRIIKEHEADTYGLTVSSASSKISRLKNELSDVDSYARNANMSDPSERKFLEVFRAYTRALQSANAFDFDDLLAQTVFLFRAFPHIADVYRRKFRHILVDEYQDTNHAQYSLIHELTRETTDGFPGASLTVVGDSDQSIYAFRGADMRNIGEFERDFPGAKVVMLEQNYRSTQNILDAANGVISNNFDRKDKKLWTSFGGGEKIIGFTGYSAHDEAQFVVDEISTLRAAGMDYNKMAVFYRTNAQTRALEEIFIRSALPYRILGGTKFYERAEIKDVLSYLVAIANPADALAVRRILNVPKRGIGPATETQLQNYADQNEISLRESLRSADSLGFGPKVSGAIARLSGLLDETTALLEAGSVGDVLAKLLEETGYTTLLRASRDAQDEARAENVDELLAVTKEFDKNNPEGTLIDFLTEVALVAAADDLDDASGTVSLMTLHTAKGLEYEAVFITGVEEELLPHRMSAGEPGGPAEERRLFYVGITRARQRLFISLAMSRAQFGQTNSALPSRYLQEIPTELMEWRKTPGNGSGFGSDGRGLSGAGRFGSSSFGGYGRSGTSAESNGWGTTEGGWNSLEAAPRPKTEWANRITNKVRDNGDLELAAGDRIRHSDFGDGSVSQVTGDGAKRVAHVKFDGAGAKKLLIKIAPIEKI
ncbi:MAG: DNA helicase-2/ATP-dependent DNA helicase PcrA [Alpinimonas sp.]|jgi:DNA helicase-2/ATP-dependent DNA helicase PcrA